MPRDGIRRQKSYLLRGEEDMEVETADANPHSDRKPLFVHVIRSIKRSTRPDSRGFSQHSSAASACRFTTNIALNCWQHNLCNLYGHLLLDEQGIKEAGQTAVLSHNKV